MFSPQVVQCTPCALMREPSDASPGHWWDRPQEPIIMTLCAWALAFRPASNVSGGRPPRARRSLTCARSWSTTVPPAGGGAGCDAGPVLGFGLGRCVAGVVPGAADVDAPDARGVGVADPPPAAGAAPGAPGRAGCIAIMTLAGPTRVGSGPPELPAK